MSPRYWAPLRSSYNWSDVWKPPKFVSSISLMSFHLLICGCISIALLAFPVNLLLTMFMHIRCACSLYNVNVGMISSTFVQKVDKSSFLPSNPWIFSRYVNGLMSNDLPCAAACKPAFGGFNAIFAFLFGFLICSVNLVLLFLSTLFGV